MSDNVRDFADPLAVLLKDKAGAWGLLVGDVACWLNGTTARDVGRFHALCRSAVSLGVTEEEIDEEEANRAQLWEEVKILEPDFSRRVLQDVLRPYVVFWQTNADRVALLLLSKRCIFLTALPKVVLRYCVGKRLLPSPRSPLRFSAFVHKVLLQLSTGTSSSEQGISVIDNFLRNLLNEMVNEAKHLIALASLQELTTDELQAVVKKLFPKELACHAVSEGAKATTVWIVERQRWQAEQRIHGLSRSACVALQFPVGRLQTHLRVALPSINVAWNASTYLAAVLEYICSELLEVSIMFAKLEAEEESVQPYIVRHHVENAIRGDEDLNGLLANFSTKIGLDDL
jgi:hypothetical protein